MPVLRAAVRVRDEPARAHPAAAPGHPRAVPALLAHVHAQQHGAAPHRARAPPPGDAAPAEPGAARRACAAHAPQPLAVSIQAFLLDLISTELPLLRRAGRVPRLELCLTRVQ